MSYLRPIRFTRCNHQLAYLILTLSIQMLVLPLNGPSNRQSKNILNLRNQNSLTNLTRTGCPNMRRVAMLTHLRPLRIIKTTRRPIHTLSVMTKWAGLYINRENFNYSNSVSINWTFIREQPKLPGHRDREKTMSTSRSLPQGISPLRVIQQTMASRWLRGRSKAIGSHIINEAQVRICHIWVTALLEGGRDLLVIEIYLTSFS